MKLRSNISLLVYGVVTCLFSYSAVWHGQDGRVGTGSKPVAQTGKAESAINGVRFVVEAEEVVTRYTPADNGAGPLWCYGSTVIARQENDVYLSVIETGKDVPGLCNTRWQLWHRSADVWKIAQSEQEYRQREPCPIGVFQKGAVFLSVNPSIEPPGVKYSRCQTLVLEFTPRDIAGAVKTHRPAWADGTYFADHSYRGFASDGANGELLLLNINAETGKQFVSYCDSSGKWHQKGKIEFPIRACYPQVALRGRAAAVMAVGDIVEPVEEWRKLKFEKLKRQWEYVFRRLFYTFTPDIRTTDFVAPVEIDTVEKTAGHIQNLDLYIDESGPVRNSTVGNVIQKGKISNGAGAAHLLYLKRPHQYSFIRDKYFPGQATTVHLEYVVIKGGKVLSRKTLAETPQDSKGLEPSFGRFHIGGDGALWVIAAGTYTDGAERTFGNYIGRILPGQSEPVFVRIDLKHPFRTFFTNTVRGGSEPADVIDLFGIADDSPNLRYAAIRLKSGK